MLFVLQRAWLAMEARHAPYAQLEPTLQVAQLTRSACPVLVVQQQKELEQSPLMSALVSIVLLLTCRRFMWCGCIREYRAANASDQTIYCFYRAR